MRDDQRFEIQSAFDLLPHVVGCSWATIWFRLNKIKNPTREEFRQKSLISNVVTGIICGLGSNGYILAINAVQELLKNGNR